MFTLFQKDQDYLKQVDFKYGTGLGFVGLMIEKVSGLSLEEYCKENIFDPLGMQNTFFTIPKEKS